MLIKIFQLFVHHHELLFLHCIYSHRILFIKTDGNNWSAPLQLYLAAYNTSQSLHDVILSSHIWRDGEKNFENLKLQEIPPT